MNLSVSAKDIAEQLIKEMGLEKAIETSKYHYQRCTNEKTASVWASISQELCGATAAE